MPMLICFEFLALAHPLQEVNLREQKQICCELVILVLTYAPRPGLFYYLSSNCGAIPVHTGCQAFIPLLPLPQSLACRPTYLWRHGHWCAWFPPFPLLGETWEEGDLEHPWTYLVVTYYLALQPESSTVLLVFTLTTRVFTFKFSIRSTGRDSPYFGGLRHGMGCSAQSRRANSESLVGSSDKPAIRYLDPPRGCGPKLDVITTLCACSLRRRQKVF